MGDCGHRLIGTLQAGWQGKAQQDRPVTIETPLPSRQGYEEDKPIDYGRDFSRLWESDESFLRVTTPRDFHFQQRARYKALVIGANQWRSIQEYEAKYKIPVHYLLYHPLRIPSAQTLPLTTRAKRPGKCVVGCRVVPARDLRKALASRENGYSPNYGDLRFLLGTPFDASANEAGWRLEHFVADLLLTCKEGYIATGPADEGVNRVFTERGAPISAPIALTIDAPEGAA